VPGLLTAAAKAITHRKEGLWNAVKEIASLDTLLITAMVLPALFAFAEFSLPKLWEARINEFGVGLDPQQVPLIVAGGSLIYNGYFLDKDEKPRIAEWYVCLALPNQRPDPAPHCGSGFYEGTPAKLVDDLLISDDPKFQTRSSNALISSLDTYWPAAMKEVSKSQAVPGWVGAASTTRGPISAGHAIKLPKPKPTCCLKTKTASKSTWTFPLRALKHRSPAVSGRQSTVARCGPQVRIERFPSESIVSENAISQRVNLHSCGSSQKTL
jgi:hypothetical protein